ADGMGGAQSGEVASALAVEELQRGEFPPDGGAERRLVSLIQAANRRIYEVSRAGEEHAGMGTTLTAVYVDDGGLAVAHVGDSRAYIYRGGELVRLTEDHSLVEELVRQGKLTEEQAAEHPQRSIITRALGIEPEVQVDTRTYPARAGDCVLVCSDGLTSMIDEQQVAAILQAEPELERAGERLIAAANEAGGRDNITVILFRLEEAGDDPPVAPTEVTLGAAVQVLAAATSDGGDRPSAAAAPPSALLTAPAPQPAAGRTRPRLARTQGRPAQQAVGPQRSERFIKTFSALAAVAIVLFLFGGGAYLASRQYFFIGTNATGIVTVYRGFPYDLPLGVRMYEQFYVSGVPIAAVPADRRARLLNHQLRSQSGAIALVQAAELGRLSR
ncbi:MAG: Stp1/IreP family PP2C-type Ser/Thr phosphatase, partial [Solirubrobacteraceae bacterium]